MPQTYCPICGAPFLGSNVIKQPIGWLTQAILLTTRHNTQDGVMLDEYFPQSSGDDVQSYPFRLGSDLPHEDPRSVLQLEAFTEDGDYIFEHSESGERLTVFHVKHTRGKTPKLSRGGPLYIPIHSMCLQLASRLTNSACTSKKSHGGSINSIKSLWEVLYRRLRGLSHPVPSTWMIQEPHDYFGGTGCRNLEWEANNDPEFGQLLEANPGEIPNLTASILQNLQPLPPSYRPVEAFYAETHKSTAFERDLEAGCCLRDASSDCQYMRSPDWWCNALIEGKLLPWLWNLDVDEVRAKQRTHHWDWEQLVRQLSQTSVYRPDDALLELPLSLRNRRRIWLILEEAKINDVAEVETRRIAAALEEQRKEWASISVPPGSYDDKGRPIVPLGRGAPGSGPPDPHFYKD